MSDVVNGCKEAAEVLGWSVAEVYRRMEDIPHEHISMRKVRFSRRELEIIRDKNRLPSRDVFCDAAAVR